MNEKMENILRCKMIECANKYIGTLYIYGGSLIVPANGTDCSDFVLECLNAAGFNLPDMRTINIANYFKSKHPDSMINRYQVKIGDLYFYGKPTISHVTMCYKVIDEKKNYRMIVGANSGTSKTKSYTVAWNKNAFVKVERDIYRLKEINCIINPFAHL